MSKPDLVYKRRWRVAVRFSVLLLTACASFVFFFACRLPTVDQWNYTRQEPKQSDLVGTWMPDEASLTLMRQQGGYDPSVQTKLVLRGDNTFDLLNMPDWWSSDFGESQRGFESYAGNWTTLKDGKTWTIRLALVSGTRFFNLIGQSPPYRLDFIIGDADENRSMIFTKVE